jgi:hypothetical protein
MTRHEIERLHLKLTEGIFFAEDRPRTRKLIETVLNRISPELETGDADILYALQILAPAPLANALIIPAQKAVTVWLSPNLETEEIETAEHDVAVALASGIVRTKNPTREETENEIHNRMESWKYPVYAGRKAREGAAA